MAHAASAGTRKPDKWVLAHDHGFHAVARAQEFWRYRRLIWFFAIQAFQMLYRRTQLGWLWVPVRPLAPLLTAAFIYGDVFAVPDTGVPYFLFLMAGMLPWNCFDGPWLWGSRGLEVNRDLVTKLYFPRMVLPLAMMAPGLAEPMVSLGLVLLAIPYYRMTTGIWYIHFGPQLLVLPLVLLASLFFAFSLALVTSLWQVRARDVRFIAGYLLGFWMLLTPVIYPITHIPIRYRWIAWLNPMAPLSESFKAALFGWEWPPVWALATCAGEILLVFGLAFWFFHVQEAETADKI